jgi:hypothetical protein
MLHGEGARRVGATGSRPAERSIFDGRNSRVSAFHVTEAAIAHLENGVRRGGLPGPLYTAKSLQIGFDSRCALRVKLSDHAGFPSEARREEGARK